MHAASPISDVGEWRKNGCGASLSPEELFRVYLDYIPRYYEDGMPLSLQLGGFFSAGPREPDRWDVPLYRRPVSPEKCCVCGHARMVMYISPEGRALPCMSLSGMEIQEKFPRIPEIGLAACITDSFYMDFISTRADKVLAHNPECRACKYRLWCRGGCRACGLEESADLLRRDPAACSLFSGGWAAELVKLMRKIKPDASSPVLRDGKFAELLTKEE